MKSEFENYLISNKDCEECLVEELKNELSVSCKVDSFVAIPCFNFERLKMNSFSKPKSGQLKGFIAVRLASDLKDVKNTSETDTRKNLNKGSVEKAIIGENNLISQAFRLGEKAPFFKTLNRGNFHEESNESSCDPLSIVEASSIKNNLSPEKNS